MKGEATMYKRWLKATLLTLGLAVQANAQMPSPPQTPNGQGGPFYPPTFANTPQALIGPQFCPGPEAYPKEPESPFSLKADGSPNAFDDCCPGCHQGRGVYVYIGGMGLMRQGLGNGNLAVKDPGVNIPGIPSNVDTGNQPGLGAPEVVNFNNIHPGMMGGVRAAIGWREGDHAFEVQGFYLCRQETTATLGLPGQLDLPFAAMPAPVGFQGNNFLWLQADVVQQQLRTQLASGEANYRFTTAPCWEFLFGVRYIDFKESYSVLTADDALVVQPVNPRQIATVESRLHNHIIGAQLGFEYALPLMERFAIGGNAKGVWGANFVDRDYNLTRGDGFVGFDTHSSTTVFSHAYELNLFADILLWDAVKLRAGYQAFWLVNIPEAHAQINFDLGNPNGARTNTGSAFFHGPVVELQIAY
jgi:hypothetical protein